jgi:hypothetical protein
MHGAEELGAAEVTHPRRRGRLAILVFAALGAIVVLSRITPTIVTILLG